MDQRKTTDAPASKPKAPPPRRRLKDQNEDIIGGPQLRARREGKQQVKQDQSTPAMRVAFRGLARDGTSAANARKQQMLAALDLDDKSTLDQMIDIDTNLVDFNDAQFNMDKPGRGSSQYKPVDLPFVSPNAPEWYDSWLDAIPDNVVLPAFVDPSFPPPEQEMVKMDPNGMPLPSPDGDLSNYHIPQIHSAAGWFLPKSYLSERNIDLTPPPAAGEIDEHTVLVKEEPDSTQPQPAAHPSRHMVDPTTNLYIAKDITSTDSQLTLIQLPPYLNLADLVQQHLQQEQHRQQETDEPTPLTTTSILASTNTLQISDDIGMYRNPQVLFYNANGSTIKAQDAWDLGYTPRYYDVTAEGNIGTLTIYPSGRVMLTINGVKFEISKGSDINMLTDAVLIEDNREYDIAELEKHHYNVQQYTQQQQQRLHDPLLPEPEPVPPLSPRIANPLVATFLGGVSRHAVCTVDIDSMVQMHSKQLEDKNDLVLSPTSD